VQCQGHSLSPAASHQQFDTIMLAILVPLADLTSDQGTIVTPESNSGTLEQPTGPWAKS